MPPITQPVTVNVFGNGLHQPNTYQTSSAPVPEGIYSLGIKDTMSDADASDPANSFLLTLQVSPDGGVNWRGVHQEQWIGGTWFNRFTQTTVANHINMAWSNTEMASGAWTGWPARAVLVLPVALRVGFEITAYPAGFNPT